MSLPFLNNNRIKREDFGFLTYEIPSKFGLYSHLTYYFEYGQLTSLVYDFSPDHQSYDSYSQMKLLFNHYLRGVVEELGDDYAYVTNDYSSYAAFFPSSDRKITLGVDNDKGYTHSFLFVEHE